MILRGLTLVVVALVCQMGAAERRESDADIAWLAVRVSSSKQANQHPYDTQSGGDFTNPIPQVLNSVLQSDGPGQPDPNNPHHKLYFAAWTGDLQGVNGLLQSGVSPDIYRDNTGSYALHVAAFNGHLAIVEALLHAGALLNAGAYDGTTPLYCAAQHNHHEVVDSLIRHHADVNQRKNNGYTALHIASEQGHLKTVRLLIHGGCDVHAETQKGWTPLMLAVEHNRVKALEALIEAGVDVNRRTSANLTAQDIVLMKIGRGDPAIEAITALLGNAARPWSMLISWGVSAALAIAAIVAGWIYFQGGSVEAEGEEPLSPRSARNRRRAAGR